jgi:Zn-dependent protease with chaperone function
MAMTGGPKAWSASQRETFLAAIARHRRASWRVTAACAAAVAILAVVVAILMAPLFYCLISLAFDVVNLVTPTPDLMGRLFRQIDALTSSKHASAADVVRLALIASLPGLALMGLAACALHRLWKVSPLFNAGAVPGRAPDRGVLAEARLADVVEEMATAAGIGTPRVIIVPGGVNAAACGRDAAHVTVLATEALVEDASRDQLEGAIAHVVGSVVNGDMTIGLRVTTTLSLFGLVARVGSALTDRRAIRSTARLWRLLVAPTSADTLTLLDALVRPFDDDATASAASTGGGEKNRNLTLGEWLLMPLMGPVVLTGFLAGLMTQMFLAPLIALAWRQRKYMADATAVQLTRDPDTLAGTLAAVGDAPTSITPWVSHLAVVDPRSIGAFGSVVPIFPSVARRVAALTRMGAHVSLEPKPRVPWPLAAVFGALLALIAALMCVVIGLLVLVSTAMSGMFTFFPAAIAHALLRWAAR